MTNKYYAFQGGKVLIDNNLIEKTVITHNGLILDVVADIPEGIKDTVKIIDVPNLIISAGLIDLQINGAGGVLFNDAITINTLRTISAISLKYGCTSFLPTLITTSEEDIKKAVSVAKEYYKHNMYHSLGIHLEGPYISKIKCGIHNPKYIKPLTQNMADFLCQEVQEVPIKLTLAPESNDINLVKQLIKGGVVISLGHSNANYSEAELLIKAGARFATHLFNAMSAFSGREPNVVGAVLNNGSIYSGIITDGYHVDYSSIEIAKKIKENKLFIVTDSVTPMGTNIKEFELAGQTIYVKNGRCVNSKGTLAGANINMLDSIKNLVKNTNITLEESLHMASLYPAQGMLLDNKIGKIAKGYIANLVVFDSKTWKNKYTMLAGELNTY